MNIFCNLKYTTQCPSILKSHLINELIVFVHGGDSVPHHTHGSQKATLGNCFSPAAIKLRSSVPLPSEPSCQPSVAFSFNMPHCHHNCSSGTFFSPQRQILLLLAINLHLHVTLKHGCFYFLFPDKAVQSLQVSVLNLAESTVTWEMGLWA